MEVLALQREIMLNEMLAERGRIILDLNQQVHELKEQLSRLAPKVDEPVSTASPVPIP